MQAKDTLTCDGNITLTSSGTFRMLALKDLTEFINDQADDERSVRLVKFNVDLYFFSDNYVQSFGGPTQVGVLLFNLAKSAVILTNECTGVNSLDSKIGSCIDNEYSYRIIGKTNRVADHIEVAGTSYKFMHVTASFTIPKRLMKLGLGAVSDEHVPENDVDNHNLRAMVYVFNVAATAHTIYYRGTYTIQTTEKNRIHALTGF